MRESAALPARAPARGDPRARMLTDVRDGLFRPGQKELPPTYFYDARGSRLFDEITRLPEYYPTRAERALLLRCAPDIIPLTAARSLAELGAGTADKSRILLRELTRNGAAQYFPIDVDAETLSRTAAALRLEFPGLEVNPVVADMRDEVAASGPRHPLLYAFLGSTIGNFDEPSAQLLLRRIRQSLRPTDRLLIGMDLVKNAAVLEAAYNDSRGVTAEFNLNVLRVLNREIAADFVIEAYRHLAFYDVERARIEMHLVAHSTQAVRIPSLGTVTLAAGESIRTEISCKYDRTTAAALLQSAGFHLTDWLVDADPLFALALAEPSA